MHESLLEEIDSIHNYAKEQIIHVKQFAQYMDTVDAFIATDPEKRSITFSGHAMQIHIAGITGLKNKIKTTLNWWAQKGTLFEKDCVRKYTNTVVYKGVGFKQEPWIELLFYLDGTNCKLEQVGETKISIMEVVCK